MIAAVLACIFPGLFYLLVGALAFWLVLSTRMHHFYLALVSPLIMAVIPPGYSVGLIAGGWLAEACRRRGEEDLEEDALWKQVARDALGVTLVLMTSLLLIYRLRSGEHSRLVLGGGLFLAVSAVVCYLLAASDRMPPRLRIEHGYMVGLFSFIPWAYLLFKLGWVTFLLGFLTFLLLPPCVMAFVTFDTRSPQRRQMWM